MTQYITKGAILSACMTYRYQLWRWWDTKKPALCFVMLNPSTADTDTDDQTIKKCVKFAETLGYGGIEVVNLFAWRATDPAQLRRVSMVEAIGPTNDSNIRSVVKSVESIGGITVLAWGANAKHYGMRPTEVVRIVQSITVPYVFRLTKGGFPAHPLYLPIYLPLTPVPTI